MSTVTKAPFAGSNNHVYYDNLHDWLSADVQSRAVHFKEALSLTKLQIVILFYLARLVSVASK